MASIDDFNKSSYLKRSDFVKPALLTIRSAASKNMAKEGQPEEIKLVVYFMEADKPMVLNFLNREAIAKITSSRDYDTWSGHKIVVYDDPNVQLQGKLVGGLRVRAPKFTPTPIPAKPLAPLPPGVQMLGSVAAGLAQTIHNYEPGDESDQEEP